MTDVTIRPLAAGDRAGWDALWKGYLAFYESAVPGEVTETTWARLIDPADDPYGYCAVDASGRLIGIVHYLFHRSTWTTSCYCYLEDLFVDPAVRGSGAGRALIEAVKHRAPIWKQEHYVDGSSVWSEGCSLCGQEVAEAHRHGHGAPDATHTHGAAAAERAPG